MIVEFWNKLTTAAAHHQIFCILLAGLSIVCISWAVERILDEYVLSQKTLPRYMLIIIIGLVILGIVQHYVRHII